MISVVNQKLRQEEIANYLNISSDYTYPKLDSRVKIPEYSEKLFLHSCQIVTLDDTNIVGLLAFYINDPESKIAFISHFSVLPEYQNKGIGTRMFSSFSVISRENGFRLVKLKVYSENYEAKNFYLNRGFNIFSFENGWDTLITEI